MRQLFWTICLFLVLSPLGSSAESGRYQSDLDDATKAFDTHSDPMAQLVTVKFMPNVKTKFDALKVLYMAAGFKVLDTSDAPHLRSLYSQRLLPSQRSFENVPRRFIVDVLIGQQYFPVTDDIGKLVSFEPNFEFVETVVARHKTPEGQINGSMFKNGLVSNGADPLLVSLSQGPLIDAITNVNHTMNSHGWNNVKFSGLTGINLTKPISVKLDTVDSQSIRSLFQQINASANNAFSVSIFPNDRIVYLSTTNRGKPVETGVHTVKVYFDISEFNALPNADKITMQSVLTGSQFYINDTMISPDSIVHNDDNTFSITLPKSTDAKIHAAGPLFNTTKPAIYLDGSYLQSITLVPQPLPFKLTVESDSNSPNQILMVRSNTGVRRVPFVYSNQRNAYTATVNRVQWADNAKLSIELPGRVSSVQSVTINDQIDTMLPAFQTRKGQKRELNLELDTFKYVARVNVRLKMPTGVSSQDYEVLFIASDKVPGELSISPQFSVPTTKTLLLDSSGSVQLEHVIDPANAAVQVTNTISHKKEVVPLSVLGAQLNSAAPILTLSIDTEGLKP